MTDDDRKTDISRRAFMRNSALAAMGVYLKPSEHIPVSGGATASDGAATHATHRLSRDLNVDLRINPVGYIPAAGKFCVTQGKKKSGFEVIDIVKQEVVHTGTLMPNRGDFGDYLRGDFSQLNKDGWYYIKSDHSRSYPFSISRSVYQPVTNLITQYLSRQRCGASTTGYLSPCHLDDGRRLDNGKHQDVTGGWHDACDLRKRVGNIIYGMIGLGKAYELQGGREDQATLDELYWGNQYFLKMQEPEGYVMQGVGVAVKQHSDSNRWTDNIIETGKGPLRMVTPNAGKSMAKMLIFDHSDDRIIQTKPAGIRTQYKFILAEALMAGITKSHDADYSKKCLHAATRCFEWCSKTSKGSNPSAIGASIQAAIELYKTTKKDTYKDFAIMQADRLKKLQANDQKGLRGFFYTSSSKHEPYKTIWQGCLAFISLCDLVKVFPSHKNVSSWKTMIADYAHHYLTPISKRNSFGIIPYGLYTGQDPGGDRKIGRYYYRYFMQPELEWWVGINANLASAGVGLIKAASILQDKNLRVIAQKQLDWIVGVNPFYSSTIVGVGYHTPIQFVNGGEFMPPTPVLPGAVMNGLGGNQADQPIFGPRTGDGDWMISEYWTPMAAYTLWLMSEISKTN